MFGPSGLQSILLGRPYFSFLEVTEEKLIWVLVARWYIFLERAQKAHTAKGLYSVAGSSQGA